MSGAFGYSQSKSNQSSEQTQGLLKGDKVGVSRNTADLANFATAQTKDIYNSNYGTFQGQTGADLAGGTTNGLPTAATTYLTSAANTMFGNASAGGALKGMWSPENTSGIVGSAIGNLGEKMMPYITDWAKYTASLPETIKTSRLGFLTNDINANVAALGGQGSSQGSSSAFGFNASGGSGVTSQTMKIV